MEQVISKEEFNNLMEIKGECRGIAPKNSAEFVRKKEGGKGLKKLEDAMVKVGYPSVKFDKLKPMSFYPLRLLAVTLAVIEKLFGYSDEEFQEMGNFRAKDSFFIRLYMGYFVSLDKAITDVPKIWSAFFTVGDLKITEFNKEKRWGILRLENYSLHPTQCQIIIGIISIMVQIIVKSKTYCKETKCTFKGDEYHEFLLKW